MWVLQKMNECLEKPILWADDRWPEEYSGNVMSVGTIPKTSFIKKLKHKVERIRKHSIEQKRKQESHFSLIDKAFDAIDKDKDLDEEQLNKKLKDIEDEISKL